MRRNPHFILFLLLIMLLAGCQAAESPLALPVQVAEIQPSATYTPFQAVSSTPRPTQTLTPTATLTPTVTLTPTTSPTPTARPCLDQAGRVEQKEVAFHEGGAPLVFRVYTPPCFDQETDAGSPARYPVLYMIHGQTYQDDQWVRLGITEAADALIRDHKAPPFLIVMPREDNTFADIYLSSFSRNVTDGLVPWIDAHYPTCAERTCRAIGGLSRGGAWALHLGFTRWELFGAIGLHSTPPFNTDPGLFPSWLKHIPADQLPRVYIDAGRRDPYLGMASSFEALLVRYGIPHEWYIYNGTHEEAYWSAHVSEYLEWYTSAWQK